MLKIVALSDTHCQQHRVEVPECDILMHVGDATGRGTEREMREFARWLHRQPASHKVFVPGNHELVFEEMLPASLNWIKEECPEVHILIDDFVIIEGIKIYGSPITPYFHNWAWNRFPDEIEEHWDAIPDDTDILLTHGPPFGILDFTPRGMNVGCPYLLQTVKKVKPDLHLFGHIHYEGGREKHIDGTSFYNVAVCDEMYVTSNGVRTIDYEEPTHKI